MSRFCSSFCFRTAMLLLLALSCGASAATLPAADAATDATIDEIDRVVPPSGRAAEHHAFNHTAVDGGWSLVRFFAPALAVAAAAGVCGGVLGPFVLLRGEALLAFSLPQAVAVGVAVALRMGWPTLPPAVIAVGLLLAVIAVERRLRPASRAGPSLVPALYVAATCVSFLVIAHSGQHVEELQNLYTGIDVAVTFERAAWVVPSLLLCAALAAAFWRRWLLLAQAPAAAELAGRSVAGWHAAFLMLLAAYVLLGTSSQGVVLVLAMLFLPATTVAPWTHRLPTTLLAAAAVAIVDLGLAFGLSNYFAWPLSHSLGAVGSCLLIASRATAFTQKG
jgi:ABC-type Mn2+/Zn2+ transport system permease subunit